MRESNNMKIKLAVLAGVAALSLAPLSAQAAFVLDTGSPSATGLPAVLDGGDFYAAEFSLGAGQTITSLQAYMAPGASDAGANFTVTVYDEDLLGNRRPTAEFSQQATFNGTGWNGLTDLSLSGLAAGKYWVAFEVGPDDFNNFGLSLAALGSAGSAAALAYAVENTDTYTSIGAAPFAAQVNAVPLPAALLLFGSGLLGLGTVSRRRI